jgi:hypothetical protein
MSDQEGIADEDLPIPGNDGVIDTDFAIAITDRDLQDRLNPESPAYFGQAYVEGIEIRYLYEGSKRTFPEIWPYISPAGTELQNYQIINPPYREYVDKDGDTLTTYQGTLGYYHLGGPGPLVGNETSYSYAYICYPDGTEDEVKVLLFFTKLSVFLDEVWINGELAYALSEDVKLVYLGLPAPLNPDGQHYYNPKYFHFMEPEVDRDGNQIGSLVRPKDGTRLIVIRK